MFEHHNEGQTGNGDGRDMNQRSEGRRRFAKDFIVDMVGTMQRMRRESLVDLQIFCVTVWMDDNQDG